MSEEGIVFTEYADRIIEILNAKSPPGLSACSHFNKQTLIKGFFNPWVELDLLKAFRMGGPSIPMVGLVCEECGEIKFYSLLALIPELKKLIKNK